MVTKGGGSANKTYLYQETKARIQNPGTLIPFLVEKMKSLGTAACPPYHIAFVIGGTSAEKKLPVYSVLVFSFTSLPLRFRMVPPFAPRRCMNDVPLRFEV